MSTWFSYWDIELKRSEFKLAFNPVSSVKCAIGKVNWKRGAAWSLYRTRDTSPNIGIGALFNLVRVCVEDFYLYYRESFTERLRNVSHIFLWLSERRYSMSSLLRAAQAIFYCTVIGIWATPSPLWVAPPRLLGSPLQAHDFHDSVVTGHWPRHASLAVTARSAQ